MEERKNGKKDKEYTASDFKIFDSLQKINYSDMHADYVPPVALLSFLKNGADKFPTAILFVDLEKLALHDWHPASKKRKQARAKEAEIDPEARRAYHTVKALSGKLDYFSSYSLCSSYSCLKQKKILPHIEQTYIHICKHSLWLVKLVSFHI